MFVFIVAVWLLSYVQAFCDPMDCSLPGSLSMGFPRQEYWNRLPFPFLRDLPDPEIKPAAPELVKATQLCLTLFDTMEYSLPGSSVHGILQARILEWVAVPFSRESSQPRDRTQVSHSVGGFFTI